MLCVPVLLCGLGVPSGDLGEIGDKRSNTNNERRMEERQRRHVKIRGLLQETSTKVALLINMGSCFSLPAQYSFSFFRRLPCG